MNVLMLAELRSRARSLMALAGGCFLLLTVLCATYGAYGGSAGFDRTFGEHPPRLLSALSGSPTADIFSPDNYLAFGFAHPLFLVLTLSVAITSGVGAVAVDVENGRAELLFTAPIARTAVLRARLSGWALAQGAVLCVALAGAFLGSRLSGDLAHVSPLVPLRVAVQVVPLVLFVAAVAFAASARARTRGTALGVAVGVAAGSYIVNMEGLLWSPMVVLRRLNPFGYYDATAAAARVDWSDAAVLTAASAAVLWCARRWLLTRDLA